MLLRKGRADNERKGHPRARRDVQGQVLLITTIRKTTSAISSYALQALFYELSGEAFCDDRECCLFNSHWQEDVLRVQYEGKPCARCLEISGINPLE
ncbi:MAG: DUF6775 family putative metallopeptidase [Thermodesulfobacteriota bacterium]